MSKARVNVNKLNSIVFVNDYGADPTGTVDSSAAFTAALAAIDYGGTLYLDGKYLLLKEILINKRGLSIVGHDARIGNIVNVNQSRSIIIADSATDGAAIRVVDVSATFKNFVLVNGPNTPSVRVDGIRVEQINASVKIYDLLIEGFQTGLRSTQNYYNTIDNTSFYACDESLRFDNCYNITLSGLKIRGNPTPVFTSESWGIRLLNGSSVAMFGGAIESFGTGAIDLQANASINLYSVYFEGETPNLLSDGVKCGANTSVVAIGCHIYLTTMDNFIAAGNSGATGMRVYSRNNRIAYPTDTKVATVYKPLTPDTTANWDVAGDNWQSPIGANVKYVLDETAGGGRRVVSYPIGHPNFLKPLDTTVFAPAAWQSAPTLPVASQTSPSPMPSIVSFENVSNTATDDPLNLRLTAWGLGPYMTVYHEGQWEKVGTRLPNQTNSTAATLADLVTDFNALLTKMRNNGIMV
jgi:hypothetical protein